MRGNFKNCLDIVLKHEGGFVNHPQDPGGATNLGITKKTLEEYIQREVTIQEVKELTVDVVSPIYRTRYWDKMMCDSLPIGVDLMVFDFGVNAGPRRSIRFLQEVIHAHQDGIIGPETIELVNEFHNPVIIITNLSQKRKRYYESLNTYKTFGRGWDRRTNETTQHALDMVRRFNTV